MTTTKTTTTTTTTTTETRRIIALDYALAKYAVTCQELLEDGKLTITIITDEYKSCENKIIETLKNHYITQEESDNYLENLYLLMETYTSQITGPHLSYQRKIATTTKEEPKMLILDSDKIPATLARREYLQNSQIYYYDPTENTLNVTGGNFTSSISMNTRRSLFNHLLKNGCIFIDAFAYHTLKI